MTRMPKLLAFALCSSLLFAPAFASKVKDANNVLDDLAVENPATWIGSSVVEAAMAPGAIPPDRLDAFQRFQTATGGSWRMWYDRVSGNTALVEGSGIPWIAGAGNEVVFRVNGVPTPIEAARHTPPEMMTERALAFIATYPELFGVRVEDLSVNTGATGPMLDYLYYIHFDLAHQGVPVERAQVILRLNHGNLVQFGTDYVSDAIRGVDSIPTVTLAQAWEIVRGLTLARGDDEIVRAGKLVIMPVSASPYLDSQAPPPLAYRLVWVVGFRRPGVIGTWEARVDAHSGELVSFKDTNDYGQIQGGTYNTDKPQTEIKLPFPYGDYGAGFADAAGVFPGSSGTCTLSGQYVNLNDNCGSISKAANASGLIDFGTSGGTDCTTPGTGGAGNTHSSRTQYWNVNTIRQKAKAYLSAGWLNSQLGVNVNITSTCNAYWNGSTLNFFRSGGGCGNTGELPGVSLHEWGHGLDQNDGNGSLSNSGESYADITAVTMGHSSCMGAGFFGSNCSGYGDPCTSCTGVRDIDYAKHSSNTPATPLGFVASSCGGCPGFEVHCGSAPPSQAYFDLSTKDLITWGLDQTTAWQLTDKLFFASRPTSGEFFSCSNNNSCSASQLFAVFRVVDDCDGNLSNGTPHASAIWAAFNRHQIGCSTAVNTDNACGCASLSTPSLSGTSGNNQNVLNWSAVAGAASYDVMRNAIGCSAGFVIIGNTSSTTYTDVFAVNGFTYYYRIQAKPSSAACPASPMSNCVTLTPGAGPNADYVSGSAVQQSDTGDNDGYPDNCETITVGFQVINNGSGNLTNVRVVSITSSAPAVTVTSSFPINLGNVSQGQIVNGTFTYTLSGATCAQSLPFTILVTADQMTGNSTGSFSFTAEQDVVLTPLVTYSFETDMQGWTVIQGTFNRTTSYGGSDGTYALASSSNLDNQCDTVRSPVIQPTSSSALTVGTRFDIEPFSSGSWWDRANVGIYNGATRTVVSPTGGRLYNASGGNGPCALTNDSGYAATFDTWADSSGFNIAAFAGQNVQIDVEYGTDAFVVGTGFRIDNLRVTNVMAIGCDQQSDTCSGCPTITLSPPTLPDGTVGTAYSQTITASGGASPYAFALSAGSLPPGLSLSSGGTISGTPTTSGTYSFTVKATDLNGCVGSKAYTLLIAPVGCGTITLSPGSLPSGSVGTPYNQTITASGGTSPYTFAVSAGSLPPGLSLSSGGTISGTPTTQGTYNFTVTATDFVGCTGSQPYAILINPAGCGSITLSPGSLPDGAEGIAYSQTITASGGTSPYTYAVTSGSLPAGLSLSSGGTLSGTPTAAGTSSFTVTATDSNSCQGAQAYGLTVDPAVSYLLGEGLGQTNGNRVKVYTRDGTASAVDFPAYAAGQWGTNVASGDINGAIYGEILTGPGPGTVYGPQVRGWSRSGGSLGKVNFYAYGTLRYGVNVGAADVEADGYAEILSGPGPGAVFGPQVRAFNFDNVTVTAISKINYYAYATLRYGVNVASGDVDGDAFGELLTGPGPGGIFSSQVRGWNYDGGTLTSINKINYNAFTLTGYGVNVAGGDVDADGYDEIASTPGPGSTHPAQFRGHNYDGGSVVLLTGFDTTYFTGPNYRYGGRVGLGDLRANGRSDLIAAPGRDPAANANVMAAEYSGGTLTTIPGVPFTPFAADKYGVNVSGGTLGAF